MQCRLARYCSPACQKAHWKQHKAVRQKMAAAAGTALTAETPEHLDLLQDTLHACCSTASMFLLLLLARQMYECKRLHSYVMLKENPQAEYIVL